MSVWLLSKHIQTRNCSFFISKFAESKPRPFSETLLSYWSCCSSVRPLDTLGCSPFTGVWASPVNSGFLISISPVWNIKYTVNNNQLKHLIILKPSKDLNLGALKTKDKNWAQFHNHLIQLKCNPKYFSQKYTYFRQTYEQC